MKLLQLLGMNFSLSLRRELAFRANLVFQLLLTTLNIASGFVVLSVIYTQTQTLAGWSLGESITLLGTFQVSSGIFSTFVEPNLSWFAGQVRDGKLDHVLLQPAPSLFMVSLGKCAPFALSQVALGLLATILGIVQMGALPSWWGILSWLLLLAVGIVIAWAIRVLLASLAFWSPTAELDVFYSALWQFGRYPVDIYRQPLRFCLTYVLPFAFLATFPVSALTSHADPFLPLTGLIVSSIAYLCVTLVWRAGLRRYTSATS
ncbi:ABC transporter permease [Ktedonobacter racemifer]|uniref:ABC transporter permease protein n=1 Tax=Ktedonobacter racemifer DSM 44963 TaxID=485913 RepID=D6TY91_KTERA|nr:ABC-2 family transporter protein [Ktedonobacter racemifer]EFH83171.1 protein of unknown function DUF990 [Ktedonobacter racemifer DSM 44963]